MAPREFTEEPSIQREEDDVSLVSKKSVLYYVHSTVPTSIGWRKGLERRRNFCTAQYDVRRREQRALWLPQVCYFWRSFSYNTVVRICLQSMLTLHTGKICLFLVVEKATRCRSLVAKGSTVVWRQKKPAVQPHFGTLRSSESCKRGV